MHFLALPWSFNFYGVDYSSMWVATNGYVDLGSSNGDYSNSRGELINNIRIAPLWDDLTTEAGDIYVDTSHPTSLSIRWDGHTYSRRGPGAGNPIDVMLTLSQDGGIRFDYGASHEGLSPTIGVSSGDGEHYTLSQRDGGNSLSANVASEFTLPGASSPLPPGLTLNPQTGGISGVPTEAGDFSFLISALDAEGTLASTAFDLAVLSGTGESTPEAWQPVVGHEIGRPMVYLITRSAFRTSISTLAENSALGNAFLADLSWGWSLRPGLEGIDLSLL